jgi:predicted ATPase
MNYAAHARAWQSQALVSAYLALLQQLCADEAVAQEYAEEALALASKYQAPYYRTWASILVSYALALEQPDEEHIGHLRGSIVEFKAAGARLRLPYYLSLLASVCGKAGRAEEGLVSIDEALTEARAHNELWWNAELHRLRGEFLLIHGADISDAEAAMLRAIEIARSQRSKSLELRATMSLAQLWITQDRSDDARRRLGDLYAWFTEGFETPDLQTARLLLEQL